MIQLELYSTLGCHLCEQAEALLQQVSQQRDVAWQVIDIAESVELVDQYGVRIPVIRAPSAGELGWPFDETRLLEWLDQISSE